MRALDDHDFVYLHLEAPDEAGHSRDVKQKVKAIELFDARLVSRVMAGLEEKKIQATVAVLPDHKTPVARGNHTHGPVPVAIYNPHLPADSVQRFDEQAVLTGALGVLQGDEFIRTMLGRVG